MRPCLRLGERILCWCPSLPESSTAICSVRSTPPASLLPPRVLNVVSQDLLISIFLEGLVPGLTYANLFEDAHTSQARLTSEARRTFKAKTFNGLFLDSEQKELDIAISTWRFPEGSKGVTLA